MTWTAPLTATAGNSLTAAQFNAHIRDNLNETEAARAFFEGNFLVASGTNSVRGRSCFRDSKLNLGTTTATSFTHCNNLTFTDGSSRSENLGPAVTLTTGTSAVVFFSARLGNSGGTSNATVISVAVENSSGTEYVSASDAWGMRQCGIASTSPRSENKYGMMHRFTGLTSGTNTFIMKYRVSAGTGSFSNREMFVIAL